MKDDLPNRPDKSPARLRGIPFYAWLVLGVGLVATVLGWYAANRQIAGQNRLRLAQEADQIISKLRERLMLCESVVHGAQGLYGASKSVERSEWREYGQGLFAGEEYPGVRALLSISFVPNTNLAAYLKITRADESPEFEIKPGGVRVDYCPIKFIQSKSTGAQLLGQDVGLMPAMRESLMKARDSAAPTLTPPLRLTALESDAAEVLLILPIYRNGAARETVAERRAALEGWVAALMSVSDLTAGLAPQIAGRTSFQIADEAASTPMLFASGSRGSSIGSPLEKTAEVAFGGRTWKVDFQAEKNSRAITESALPILVLTSGSLGSFLVFYLLWSLGTTRSNALNLHERDQQLRLALQSARMGVWQLDVENNRLTWSDDLIAIFGLAPNEQPLTRESFLHLISPQDRARVDESLKRAFANSTAYHEVYQILWADGSTRWIDDCGRVYFYASGEATKMVGVAMDVTERKIAEKQVEDLNRQLVETSRQAGMSEIATGVLHNVGNVLNSVNVSASLLRDSLSKSQIHNLVKATNLLRDHAEDSAAFLTTDPRGQRLPGFLIKLGDHIASEQLAWEKELVGLGTNIEHIKEIVAMQQSYARLTGVTEALSAEELVKDALQINESALNRHGVELVEDFQPVPLVVVDKHKVLQILINLFRNAKHALDNSGRRDKVLTLSIRAGDGDRVFIQVRDNGIGIAPENISRIFQHGFTTKKEGHGFGLHSGANAAKEMGGKLTGQSDGVGHGAVFTLELPIATMTSSSHSTPNIATT
jgi:PAS domain S-box-containing protein